MLIKYLFRKIVLSQPKALPFRLKFVVWLALLGISNIGNSQQNLTIAQIQGSSITSPYVGQMARIPHAVITYVNGSSMIVQSPAAQEDGDPNTSEGILVSGAIPNWATPGKNVSIAGRVSEWSEATLIEGTGLIIEELSQNEAIELPLLEDELDNVDYSNLDDLEALEWMSFEFRDAKVCGPTTGSGDWLHVYFTDHRPSREPGIPSPGINGLPEFDRNFEIFQFLQSSSTLPNLPANSTIEGRGIVVPDDDRFSLLGLQYQAEIANIHSPVAANNADVLSIASANLLRLDDSNGSFGQRLPKMVDYMLDGLGAPDIIGVQEVHDLSTLQALADGLNESLGSNTYRSYLEQGNNSTSINSGYLVNHRIEVEAARPLGRSQQLSLGGSLHDRPPFLLEAKTKTMPQISFKVINLHLRSLSGIEGSDSYYVRTKRNEQAVSVAQMVQSFKDDNLVVLGDFNAYPFSDGYVDGYHQIQGGESEGAQFENQAIVTPALNDVITAVPEEDRYTYVYIGNTQQIDHILFNDLQEMQLDDADIYRGNADAPNDWSYDYNRPERVSDHDAVVAYFELDHPWGDVVTEPMITRPYVATANPHLLDAPLTFYPKVGDYYEVAIYDMAGRKIKAWTTAFIDDDDSWSLPISSPLVQGYYVVEIAGADFHWAKPILFDF